MKCLLCDINPAMREAWKEELGRRPRLDALCSVVAGDITGLKADAAVSPANSSGIMRGGVDGVYTRVFGAGVENRLQAIIRTLPGGELPVGEALLVPTGHTGIPWLISAPTMRSPSVLRSGDPVVRSARAAMRVALEQSFASIAFPGMGTGTGRLPFDVAARAMFDGMDEALFSF